MDKLTHKSTGELLIELRDGEFAAGTKVKRNGKDGYSTIGGVSTGIVGSDATCPRGSIMKHGVTHVLIQLKGEEHCWHTHTRTLEAVDGDTDS